MMCNFLPVATSHMSTKPSPALATILPSAVSATCSVWPGPLTMARGFFTWSGSGRSFSCPTAMQMSARAANTPHPLVSSFIRHLLGSAPERMGETSFLASLSAADLAAGERLLQVGHPVSRHPGGAEVQRGELLEVLQLLQARVRHLGVGEVQLLELLEMLQLLQARIRHPGAVEVQRGELLEILQLLQPRIRHPGAAEVQRGELLEILQLLQARIRHRGAVEVQRGELFEILQLLQARTRHMGDVEGQR